MAQLMEAEKAENIPVLSGRLVTKYILAGCNFPQVLHSPIEYYAINYSRQFSEARRKRK